MGDALKGKVAVVAGATRGAGRGIAIELGAAGAMVYVTGRSTRAGASDLNRPETIEQTAELITAAGGVAIPLRVDHTDPAEVAGLRDRLASEQNGRLDILVNNIWGADPLTQWGVPFWEHDLRGGLLMQQRAVTTHLITSSLLAPLMVHRRGGLIVETTDGDDLSYCGSLYYDVAKNSVMRLAKAQAEDLRPYGVAAVSLTPGFMRTEATLDAIGRTEENWREAIPQVPHFGASESPRYIGRAVAALAADPMVLQRTGQLLSTWALAAHYGFTDIDGTRPDWGGYTGAILAEMAADERRDQEAQATGSD